MKKTVPVSIGGLAFILEEDTHKTLEQYIEKVKLNLGTSEDAEEIISDVEGRLAELLREYLTQAGRQVVDSTMVEKAISVMGTPEDFNITGEPIKEKAEKEKQEPEFRAINRSLYRDEEDRYLGGVCAGLAHYLGWEPIAVRLIFVALLFGFGSGVIVYIIMWILVPTAETTSEKLRMHGEPVNLESIKNRVENFGAEVKEFGKNFKGKKFKFGKRVEESVREVGAAFARIIGVGLLLLGIMMCFWVFNHLIGGNLIPGEEDRFVSMVIADPSLVFERNSDYFFLYWGIVGLVLLFITGLFRSGIRLLFHIPLKNKFLNIANVVMYVLAFGFILFGGIRLGRQFNKDETVHQVQRIETGTDTLVISVDRDEDFSDKILADDSDFDELIKLNGKKIVFGYPGLDIRRSENGSSRMEIEKSAHGSGKMEAIRNAENIFYPIDISGDTLNFKPVFTSSSSDKFRVQNVNVRLFVPDSTVVLLREGAFRVLRLESSEIQESVWKNSPYSTREFIMEKGGLKAR